MKINIEDLEVKGVVRVGDGRYAQQLEKEGIKKGWLVKTNQSVDAETVPEPIRNQVCNT